MRSSPYTVNKCFWRDWRIWPFHRENTCRESTDAQWERGVSFQTQCLARFYFKTLDAVYSYLRFPLIRSEQVHTLVPPEANYVAGCPLHGESWTFAEVFCQQFSVVSKRSVSNGITLDNQITNWDLRTQFGVCAVLPWWI